MAGSPTSPLDWSATEKSGARETPARLWAEGEVRQAAVFGEHLRLRRRIEADLGGNAIRLTDTVTNHGFDPTPHMLLYHINLGWPLVDEGAQLVAPIARISVRRK